MNISKARQYARNAWRLAALCAVIFAAGGARAENGPQSGRFLLIFETSPVLKKNLPAVRQTLGVLFSSNLQNEMRSGDDLAVWTVDQKLHTDTYPMESWDPDQAETYTDQLTDFLKHQKYSRHAGLAAVQPLLNRVVKSSERLTVLIFCDSQSSLVGTPYDSGVNDIITNAAARLKDGQSSFILVLRSYHGEYLGCSVNRSGPLSFPKFPAPPKPAPAPAVNAAPAPVVAPVTGPVVTPIPALIIVGTNASTNVSALASPAYTPATTPSPAPMPLPAPPPVANPQTTAPTTAASTIAPAPPENPAPIPTAPVPVQPAPTPSPAPQMKSAPEPAAVSAPATVTVTAPQSGPPSGTAPTVAASATAETSYVWPLILGGGLLVMAVGLVTWFMTRTRRPQSSLITSSMQNDPRLPPRK